MKTQFLFLKILLITSCKEQITISQIDAPNYSIEYQQSDSELYITICTVPLYIASIGILENEKVTVYHTSSAIGTLEHHKISDTIWTNTDTFVCAMRDTDRSPDTIDKRKKFYQQYGWIANTMEMGNIEPEFLLDTTKFKHNETILGMPASSTTESACLSLVSGDPNLLMISTLQRGYLFNYNTFVVKAGRTK